MSNGLSVLALVVFLLATRDVTSASVPRDGTPPKSHRRIEPESEVPPAAGTVVGSSRENHDNQRLVQFDPDSFVLGRNRWPTLHPERYDVEQMLRYRGPSTRCRKKRLRNAWKLGPLVALDAQVERDLDVLLSAAGIPYVPFYWDYEYVTGYNPPPHIDIAVAKRHRAAALSIISAGVRAGRLRAPDFDADD